MLCLSNADSSNPYQSGEKFNLAKQLGLKLVNHQWLEDCLRTWALLSEEDYSRSGLEVELSEAEAKDSEDDGILKSTTFAPKVLNGAVTACLEGVREEVKLQMRMENAEKGFLLEHCLQEGRKTSVHVSPSLVSPRKSTVTRIDGDVQKANTRDASLCEMQVERREADLTSPLVLRAKRMKAVGSPEMASNSKRQNFVENADDNGGINGEVNNQHGDERHSAEEAVCDMQLDGPDSGFSCKTEKVIKLTTPSKVNINIANMQLVSKSPVSKKDENRALSPNTGGTTCNVVAHEEENTTSALLSAGTPQTAPGKKHSTLLGTGLDSVISNIEGLLNSKDGTENIQKGITDEDLMEVTETEFTPGTGAQRVHTLLPPASTLSKEHESLLQINCSSAGKSTEVRRPSKNIRKSKLKAAQKVLCMESNSVHSSPGEMGVGNLPLKGSLPESNIEKAGENVNQGRDFRKVGEEQNIVCTNQMHESKLLNEDNGNVEVHHTGELGQNAKTSAKASVNKKQGKLQKKSKLKISEKSRSLTREIMVLDKENAAQLMALDKKKAADNDTLPAESLGKEADNHNMPSNQRSTSNENACGRQGKESKLLNSENCNMIGRSRGKIGQPAKAVSEGSGTRKQGKLSKKPDLISTKKMKPLTVEKAILDKENAVVHQSQDTKGEPKSPHEALVVRKSHKKVVCPDNMSQTTKTTSQRCFALSGHRLEIKPLQALVKKLGGKLCRDSHQWSHQTTHLVIAGQLRRTEKLFAAAAAGRWILREEYLKDSSEAGVFLDEKNYEWHGSGMTKDGSISFDAPRKWRELRENTGWCALEGLRVLLYGECIIPSLDTLRRAIRAGGADLVATCPPYTRFLASKVDFAIVNPGTPKNDYWIQEFLSHSVACVTTDFFVDFVCKPSSCLDRHILYDTHNLVQVLVTRLQASNMGAKMDKKGSSDVVEECGGEEISCVICGRSDREDVMLLCGDDNGSGCGTAMHIDCCKPPLAKVPAHDWYCAQCTKPASPLKKRKKKAAR